MKVSNKASAGFSSLALFGLSALMTIGMSGCNQDTSGAALGESGATGPAATIPKDTGTGSGTGTGTGSGGGGGTETTPALGNSCHTTAAGRYCIALKYVVMKDSSGNPAISQSDVLADLNSINSLWDQCGIAFQIDEFQEVNPADYGVSSSPASMNDLSGIRSAFVDDTTLLVATTVGTWSISANAWTSMPGGSPYGAVIEGSVGNYGPIVAHELGHYLNLDHVSDSSNLMNPVIYTSSTALTASQCSAAVSSLSYFWSKMLR